METSPSSTDVTVNEVSSKPTRSLSQHQKYRKALVITTELASIVSEASRNHFDRRLKLIKDLLLYWKNGEEVALTEIDDGNLLHINFYIIIKIRSRRG